MIEIDSIGGGIARRPHHPADGTCVAIRDDPDAFIKSLDQGGLGFALVRRLGREGLGQVVQSPFIGGVPNPGRRFDAG